MAARGCWWFYVKYICMFFVRTRWQRPEQYYQQQRPAFPLSSSTHHHIFKRAFGDASSTPEALATTEVVLSPLYEGMEVAKLTDWIVNVGDKVANEQPLCEVETEMAFVDIGANHDGYLAKILVEKVVPTPFFPSLLQCHVTWCLTQTSAHAP